MKDKFTHRPAALLLSVLALAMMALLSACDGDPEWDEGREFDRALIGRWMATAGENTITLDFKDDHTYIRTVSTIGHSSTSETGDWWTVGNNLTLMNSEHRATSYNYRIEGGILRVWNIGENEGDAILYYGQDSPLE